MIHKISYEDWVGWFADRHRGANANTIRRGGAAFNGYLRFCHAQGWVHESALRAQRLGLARGDDNKDWLHPEQVDALQRVVLPRERFDDYSRFRWEVLLTTGLRTEEVVELQPRDCSPRNMEVVVRHGKGRGDGKRREVPVDQDFVSHWQQHVERFDLAPDDAVFFERTRRFEGGDDHIGSWELGRRNRPACSASARTMTAAVREEAVQASREGLLDSLLIPEFELQPKVLRKTFACNQLILHELGKGGLSIMQLKQALGHGSLEVTKLYLADVERYLGRLIRPVGTAQAASIIIALRAAEKDDTKSAER